MATTAAQRGKAQSHLLRDFSSPILKPWRRQAPLQCQMDGGSQRPLPPEAKSPDSLASVPQIGRRDMGEDDGGLKELREKLLGHLRETADKMKLEMGLIGPASPAPEPDRPDKSWNLRSRRSARKAPAKTSECTPLRLRSERSEKKKKRRRLTISLSREEIEEDVFALTGSRPRRRPKKRPRNVQFQLDAVFPGMWLSEITPELYKVAG